MTAREKEMLWTIFTLLLACLVLIWIVSINTDERNSGQPAPVTDSVEWTNPFQPEDACELPPTDRPMFCIGAK